MAGVISKAARRARNLRYRYGLQGGAFERKLAEQGGKCALASCQRVAEVVDHAHDEEKRVRGLLCNPCNVAIGLFGESAERLEEAARYVRGA